MIVRRSPARVLGNATQTLFDLPQLILVEGGDEVELITRLLSDIPGPETIVHDMNGKDGWNRKVSTIATDPLFSETVRTVGFIRDAELDVAATEQSCQSALGAGSLPVTRRSGEIGATLGRSAGFYLLPGDDQAGMLEDLVLSSGEEGRLESSEAFLSDLASRGFPEPKTTSKALLQSYLAGTRDSPKTLAVALDKAIFDLSAECFAGLRDFLMRLSGTSVGSQV